MRPSHPPHMGVYSGPQGYVSTPGYSSTPPGYSNTPPGYSNTPPAVGQHQPQQYSLRVAQGLNQRLSQHNVKYYPSLSGSETDVSTSTENLTQEERYVLRNMEREEPQGEEQRHPVSHQQMHLLQSPHPGMVHSYHPPPPYSDRLIAQQIASNNAKREALRLDAMIAASRKGTPLGTPSPHLGGFRSEDLYGVRMSGGSRFPPVSHYQSITSMASSSVQESNLSRLAPSVYSHPTVTDPLLKSPKSFYHDPSVLLPKKGFNVSSSGAYFDSSAVSKENELQAHNDIIAQLTREMRLNNTGHLSGGSDVESSGSTSTLNNPAATAERIAALQAKHNPSSNIPVPVYKSGRLNESLVKLGRTPPAYNSPNKSYDLNVSKDSAAKLKMTEARKMSVPSTGAASVKPDNLPLLSYSQPDLANLSSSEAGAHPPMEGGTPTHPSHQLGSPDVPLYSHEMVNIITNQNRQLKAEVEAMRRKILRLDTLEKEMMKIHEAYQALREHSEKREMLEKSARTKLQAEILNHQEINKEIRDRHDAVMGQIMSGDTSNIPGLDSILRGEILRKDALITQLANQNKELMASKERQEIECAEQRETLQEQRTHIDVLDSALSTAQNNVLRLEEELRQKEVYADRVKQMTKSLEQLQAASEKRETMEKKLRAKLEEELKELRREQASKDEDEGRDGEEDVQTLIRKLSEFEEKIIRLESERTEWEQRYLEESAMRQVAIDAASIPKDAKIAVLEKTSAESEKKIAEARSDKMKQMAELQQYQRRIGDFEMKIKSLESSLAERNTMIKVLQKRAFEKPENPENVLSIPIHDALSSSNSMILHSKQLSSSLLGSPISHLTGNHSSQHSTPVPFSLGSAPLSFGVSHASQHSSPVPFTSGGHALNPSGHQHSLSHLAHNPAIPGGHASLMSTPGSPRHAPQLSAHMAPGSPRHAPQLSTPLPPGSPRHAVADFYEGISASMSSTARGPLGKFGLGGRVRSGSPAHIQRSSTPSDLLRSATPTRDGGKQSRRDSAPGDVFSSFSESPGKTLINTSDLYTTGATVSSGGTLPKMSFALMKEENSRTLPSKNYTSLAESLRDSSYSDGRYYPSGASYPAPSGVAESRLSSGSTEARMASGSPNTDVKDAKPRPGSGGSAGRTSPDWDWSRNETIELDETVNSSLLNKDSLLLALKQEKEMRPENFWRV